MAAQDPSPLGDTKIIEQPYMGGDVKKLPIFVQPYIGPVKEITCANCDTIGHTVAQCFNFKSDGYIHGCMYHNAKHSLESCEAPLAKFPASITYWYWQVRSGMPPVFAASLQLYKFRDSQFEGPLTAESALADRNKVFNLSVQRAPYESATSSPFSKPFPEELVKKYHPLAVYEKGRSVPSPYHGLFTYPPALRDVFRWWQKAAETFDNTKMCHDKIEELEKEVQALQKKEFSHYQQCVQFTENVLHAIVPGSTGALEMIFQPKDLNLDRTISRSSEAPSFAGDPCPDFSKPRPRIITKRNQKRLPKCPGTVTTTNFPVLYEFTELMYQSDRHLNLTAQKKYEDWSPEELRLADYGAGRKYDPSLSADEVEDLKFKFHPPPFVGDPSPNFSKPQRDVWPYRKESPESRGTGRACLPRTRHVIIKDLKIAGFRSITAQKEYSKWSFEELRMADYKESRQDNTIPTTPIVVKLIPDPSAEKLDTEEIIEPF